MGLSRRFLNVIVDKRIAGFQALRCIDLDRYKLFNTKPPNGVRRRQSLKMLPLPTPTASPCFSMRASSGQGIHCCPAPADRRVLCVDQSGRSLLLEADTSRIVMMPRLHPKLDPVSFYIPYPTEPEPQPVPEMRPRPDLDDLLHVASGGGTFFIMDRIANPEGAASCQFEALVHRNPSSYIRTKCWNCDPLPPPPPYVHRDDDTRHSGCLEISSYTVLKDDKGGCHICISIDGVGTYCLDTVSYKWSQVGKWTLPFRGKVEYVPEFNLWFGFSVNDGHFAAADLSRLKDSQPQLLDSWQELEPPQGWQQRQDPQLVSLGSGRFCITRFFLHRTGAGAGTRTPNTIGSGDESVCYQNNFTALTGVEVVADGSKDQVNLGIVKHKTRCHKASYGDETIVAVL